MAAEVGVILSGCGYLDGAEIHEAVLTLYFLDRAGIRTRCFAPNREQQHVVNHLTGESTNERRNILVEAARLARGQVHDIGQASMQQLDALVIPGGYGVAKNLSNYAAAGAQCELDADVLRLIHEARAHNKPILAICIAPAILAVALHGLGTKTTLTIGDDARTAAVLESLGARHRRCPATDAVIDHEHHIISTPAYMLGQSPKEIAAGIAQAIDQLVTWL